MNRPTHFPIVAANLLFAATVVLAQRPIEPGAQETCVACGTCGSMILIPLIFFFALNIALLVWVARDAKA
ncbi:MAG: hypothetical protein KIT57_14855 [Blastocatellales bacterium]|nr:hypothetical protein [Blastocatellales bacterium]